MIRYSLYITGYILLDIIGLKLIYLYFIINM